MGAKCLFNVFTLCILACMSWLTVTVRACAGFLQHECVFAFIQYVGVLVMVSYLTGMFYSTGYGLPNSVCVLAVFIVRVCTGYVLPQHVCVLVDLQYVDSLVIVSCEHVLTWLTAARLCRWQ